MTKFEARSLFFILALAVLTSACAAPMNSGSPAAPAATAADDETLVQKLIEGSPWSGRFNISITSGCSTFAFQKDAEGKPQGELLRSTSTLSSSPSGKLVDVRVTKEGVRFKTPVGAEYYLKVTPGDILTGHFYGVTGVARAQKGYIELSSQSQCP